MKILSKSEWRIKTQRNVKKSIKYMFYTLKPKYIFYTLRQMFQTGSVT